MKQDLEQEIAKLLGEFKRAALLNGIEDFVRLFDQIGPKRQVGLLAVPRAAAGSAQARLDGDKVFKQLSYRFVCFALRGSPCGSLAHFENLSARRLWRLLPEGLGTLRTLFVFWP